MSAQLRSELLKQRTTRTGIALFASMLGLVAFAVLLHGLGVADENVDTTSEQLTLLIGPGVFLGTLFAGLLGALSITAEIRHGTIRPTLLVAPERERLIAAKVAASTITGAGFGLAAAVVAAGVGAVTLDVRSSDVLLGAGDYALLFAGGATAAALWAAIGVGLGALVRSQVPTLIGICAWLLFVEGLLVSDVTDIAAIGRFAPGAAASAITGQDPDRLLAPAAGLAVLVLYAAGAAVAGAFASTRRDVP